jgi:predicted nucleotidyltransferase
MNTDKKDSLIEVLVLNRDELNAIARKYGANNIRIFGSVARREESASQILIFWWTWMKMQVFLILRV